jgi:ATP-dependent RNA helicase DDX54/DBP10
MLDNVINFNFPDRPKLFIHRVGRTGRAGKDGKVFSIVSAGDIPYFYDLKVILGREIFFKCENVEQLKRSREDTKIVSF